MAHFAFNLWNHIRYPHFSFDQIQHRQRHSYRGMPTILSISRFNYDRSRTGTISMQLFALAIYKQIAMVQMNAKTRQGKIHTVGSVGTCVPLPIPCIVVKIISDTWRIIAGELRLNHAFDGSRLYRLPEISAHCPDNWCICSYKYARLAMVLGHSISACAHVASIWFVFSTAMCCKVVTCSRNTPALKVNEHRLQPK